MKTRSCPRAAQSVILCSYPTARYESHALPSSFLPWPRWRFYHPPVTLRDCWLLLLAKLNFFYIIPLLQDLVIFLNYILFVHYWTVNQAEHQTLSECLSILSHLIMALVSGGKCPFGQLPILEVDGVTLCQSMTILRFVAKRHGLSNFTINKLRTGIRMGPSKIRD